MTGAVSAPWAALPTVGVPTAVVDLDTFDRNAAALLRRAGGTPIRVDPIGAAPADRVMFHCPVCQPRTS